MTTTRDLIEKVETCKNVGQELVRVVRIQPASRDPQDLLDPATWESRCWAGYSEGVGGGVSACWDTGTLATYFAGREANFTDCVVVEMDAFEAEDADEDAEHGALLVWPQSIVSVTPIADTAVPQLIEFAELRDLPYTADTRDGIDARTDQLVADLVARFGTERVNGWLGPVA